MTSDRTLSQTEISARVRTAQLGLYGFLFVGLAGVALWATGGQWVQGVVAFAWLGLAAYHFRNLRRLRRREPRRG